MKEATMTIAITVFLVPRVSRNKKKKVPAINVDTLRGGRKGSLNINLVRINRQW